MIIQIRIPDAVGMAIINEMRAPKPEASEFDNVCRAIISDEEAIRASAEVLLRYYSEGRIKFIKKGDD